MLSITETGLPVVTFSELEQNVLEGAEEPALACIILSDESLGGQPASFDITSSPGSATGILLFALFYHHF